MSDDAKKKSVILGVSASIAAYKAADIASQLSKLGHDVTVVMTKDALDFVSPLTLEVLSRNPVVKDFSDERAAGRVGHIELADNADLVLLAPATANLIAQLANGLAATVLTAICLATRAPFLIAPAMNGKMWNHVATQRNVEVLRGWGYEFIGPDEGMLSCGYVGVGRLWPVEGIVERADEILREEPAGDTAPGADKLA